MLNLLLSPQNRGGYLMFKLDDIESIKRAIRVDHNLDDDLILNVYLPAAQRQIKAAISLDEKDYSFFESNSVYNLAVLNTLAHHYDNRSSTTDTPKQEVPLSSLTLIQALRGDLEKWRAENVEVDTDGLE